MPQHQSRSQRLQWLAEIFHFGWIHEYLVDLDDAQHGKGLYISSSSKDRINMTYNSTARHDSQTDSINIYFLLTSLTPIFALAEVSMKAQLLNCLARLSPWSLPTTLSSSRSHLFPTSTMGTSSLSLTRRICSLRSWWAQS